MAMIHLKQWASPVDAKRSRILDAALDAGVPYPHGCGTGECGSCKTKLISGEVKMDPYSKEALTDEERADGWILACRARAVTDVQLQWLAGAAPALPVSKVQCKVAGINWLADDVMGLTLSLPTEGALEFRAGQFAKLRFGGLPMRSYSMSNQPKRNELEFHIRMVPNGVVSKHVAGELKLNDMVEVQGPYGDAFWEMTAFDLPNPLLLVAGGTGMAPILSILDAALTTGMPGTQIHVYHGVRTAADLYLADQLNARAARSKFRFVPVYSNKQVTGAEFGMVHEVIAKDFAELKQALVHVAGPPPMVDAVTAVVKSRGVSASRIRADAFYAAQANDTVRAVQPAAAPEKKGFWKRLVGA
jgi:naphthalene 1,2-dioxygenase ferredoxin reductase component